MKAISQLTAALLFAVSTGAAWAQTPATPPTPASAAAPATPATAATPATSAAPVFKHNCVKAEWPGRVATQSATKRFDTEHKAYSDCIRAFVAEQSKSNQESVAKANAHVTAGNAAIAEFNEYIKDLNRQTGKEDPKKDEKK